MRGQPTALREPGRKGRLSPLLRLALLFGVVVHLLGFLVVRIASDPLPAPQESPAFVSLLASGGGGDAEELSAQASLFDSAPLFIPGEWSSASEVFSSRIVQDRRKFPDFEPDIELMDEVRPTGLRLGRMPDVRQPSDMLDLRFWDLFRSFGEGKTQTEGFEGLNSVAVVRIISRRKGHSADDELRLEVDWQSEEFTERPVTYFLHMVAPGLPIGAPLLKQSSGSDVWDAEVLQWLTRPDTLARMPAGFLELRVFPE